VEKTNILQAWPFKQKQNNKAKQQQQKKTRVKVKNGYEFKQKKMSRSGTILRKVRSGRFQSS
jgi:hypothetical protein